MNVREMQEWLKDKPSESEIVKKHEWTCLEGFHPLLFSDIGLKHENRIRVDPEGEQGELF